MIELPIITGGKAAINPAAVAAVLPGPHSANCGIQLTGYNADQEIGIALPQGKVIELLTAAQDTDFDRRFAAAFALDLDAAVDRRLAAGPAPQVSAGRPPRIDASLAARDADNKVTAKDWIKDLQTALTAGDSIARQMESELEDLPDGGGPAGGEYRDEVTAALAAINSALTALGNAEHHAANAAHLAAQG